MSASAISKRTIIIGFAAMIGLTTALPMPAFALVRAMAAHHGGHGFHHHRFWPYGGWVVAYPNDQFAQPTGTVSPQVPAPHCTFSRETVTVPSEDGGEKKITITRC